MGFEPTTYGYETGHRTYDGRSRCPEFRKILGKVTGFGPACHTRGVTVEPILLSLEEASARLPKGFSPRTLKRLKKAGKISRGISNPGGVWVADLEVLKRELMRW